MELVREIIVPTQNTLTLRLPDALIGKQVEVIAFELEEKITNNQTSSEKQATIQNIFEGVRVDLNQNQPPNEASDAEREERLERLNKSLEGLTFNSGGYKFNRDEANDYD